MKRWVTTAVAALAAIVFLVEAGQAALIEGKAWLAPILIENAFYRSAETGRTERPWPWADGGPYWRLTAMDGAFDRFVLEGATMRMLAFGPVHERMGQAHLVFGHRDTHFSSLGKLKPGDIVTTERPGESPRRWRVVGSWVGRKDALFVPGGGEEEGLLLVTCYPFDAVRAGGPGRYLVWLTPAP